jgi:hypothetical protein
MRIFTLLNCVSRKGTAAATTLLFAGASMLGASPASDLWLCHENCATAELFAPGIVNQPGKPELGASRCAFSPGGTEMAYARFDGERMNIVFRHFADGAWGAETVAPFSGTELDFEPVLTADGKRIYFTSRRDGNKFRIYYSDRSPDGWEAPHALQGEVNSAAASLFPLPVGNDFYFVSLREGGLGGMDIYVAPGVNPEGAKVQNLDAPINSPGTEFDPCFSPDGKFVIFSRNWDLFVSRRDETGAWGEPVNLGAKVNSPDLCEVAPIITPDGKVLLFTRFGSGTQANVYAIGIKSIPALN